MEDNNQTDKRSAGDNKPIFEKKPIGGMAIVGINLLVLVVYTLLIKLAEGFSGLILNAIILLFHVIFCLGMAADRKNWVWLLSALLVLAIGFSTCTGLFKLR